MDLSSPREVVRECLISFLYIQRANALGISRKILEALSHPSRGQAYDGASVMSGEVGGVQAKIKEISPLAIYTHCYSGSLAAER